jgi:hypothetical protein
MDPKYPCKMKYFTGKCSVIYLSRPQGMKALYNSNLCSN